MAKTSVQSPTSPVGTHEGPALWNHHRPELRKTPIHGKAGKCGWQKVAGCGVCCSWRVPERPRRFLGFLGWGWGGWGGGMITFLALVHMLNALQLVWGGWGGGMITFLALVHMLNATQLVWVGWGDDNVPCTCTHVECYATGLGGVGGW